MKKTLQLKPLLLSMAVAASAAATVAPATVQAGVSANAGMVSTYVFRGVLQTATEKSTASAGVDYEHESGIYVGTWGSSLDDADNLEYDLYAGWGGEFNGVALGAGVTGYYYTDGAATAFEEMNLSAGYGPVSIAYDFGKAKPDVGDDTDYSHLAISAEYAGFTGTFGINDAEDYKGEDTYLQVDYGFEIAKGVDGSISYINFKAEGVDSKDYLIFGVSKSFDVM